MKKRIEANKTQIYKKIIKVMRAFYTKSLQALSVFSHEINK